MSTTTALVLNSMLYFYYIGAIFCNYAKIFYLLSTEMHNNTSNLKVSLGAFHKNRKCTLETVNFIHQVYRKRSNHCE